MLSPKEIESAIYTHPEVSEAAVVGRPDPVYGEVPVAFVVPRDGHDTTTTGVRQHLSGVLAKYKLPDILLTQGIPKNPLGKPDKPALLGRFQDNS